MTGLGKQSKILTEAQVKAALAAANGESKQMIHIRVDDEELNANAKFACGRGWPLPEGDTYYFECEYTALQVSNCPACNPTGPQKNGTPLSELSGRPGEPGYAEFRRIARSWGHD